MLFHDYWNEYKETLIKKVVKTNFKVENPSAKNTSRELGIELY